ncbi:MAG: BACON domain-containing protein [Bacteroidales bacterium]|nr:BACON domain-containing protein [Bacteroidales bacterium]
MKKIILYTMVILAAAACTKNSEYDQTLGLLSANNLLSADGGSTQVAVFSNTSWTVEMDHPVSWASIDRFGGHKTGHLVFDYEINYGRARRVKLIFKAGGETRTMNMYQQARYDDSKCKMKLDASSVVALAEGKIEEIPFETNLIYNLDEMFLTVTYPEGQEPEADWVSLVSVEKDKVTVEIAPNTTGVTRMANMRLSHTDAGSMNSEEGDTIYSNTVTVVQTL